MDPIEQEIQAKSLTAPRITPADIEAAIASEHCFTAGDGARLRWLTEDHDLASTRESVEVIAEGIPARSYSSTAAAIDARAGIPVSLGLLTFCVLVMRNGFTVVGKSACASPENFDAELGRKIAREDAIRQCWALLGYELRSKLADAAAMEPACDFLTQHKAWCDGQLQTETNDERAEALREVGASCRASIERLGGTA